MIQILEKFSRDKQGARVLKIIIAFTVMPAIIMYAIVLDVFTNKERT